MLLQDIKQYLFIKKQATLNEIASELKIDKGVIESAIEHWIRKKRVEKIIPESACKSCPSGCSSCSSIFQITLYRWIEQDNQKIV